MKSIWRHDPPLTNNPLKFFLFVSRPHRKAALFATLFVVLASILRALIPYIYKVIIDTATHFTPAAYTTLWESAAAYILITLGGNLLWRASGFTGLMWGTGVRATARETLSSYAVHHSHQYFSDRFAGSISSKIKQAGDSMREFVEAYLWQFLSFVVSVIASFIVVFLANPFLGFILMGLFVVITPLNIYFARNRVPISSATQSAETELTGVTVDMLTNISAVHEYAQSRFEIDRLREYILRRRRSGMRNWRYGEWTLVANNVVQAVFTGAMLLCAVYLFTHQAISTGDIILLLSMIALIEDQLTFIGSQFNSFAENWGTVVESLNEVLVPHGVADAQHAREAAIMEGSIVFEEVSFGYGGAEVFSDLSFTIPAGQRVGVVGRSGAGKSTLTKLLLRHYDLTGGKIIIDGHDIASITKNALRRSIAVVPQEPALFHRSIAENIAYSKPDSSREEIVRVAKLAQAHDFIESLPQGYDTLVGERGIKLSGGQRQRVAIARALLKDAPVLLLDEATSALDSESEVAVQQALINLMEKRTVIAIAHRLSTLRAMDRIIVFDAGKIVEDGTHEQLVARGGLYADLWSHQAGGFLED
ncbi:MAG TPA: ABC transporter ATP-binding protein [Candidatus Paceibacterota bacterium]|nr:ABC transporter ATP-binding protein [Candidatus Paceibacterota bacterium]